MANKDIPNARSVKMLPTKYWHLLMDNLKEKLWVPRMRCPECGHPWRGTTDTHKDTQGTLIRELSCNACHARFDKPVLRKKYKSSRKACPHCASLQVEKRVKVIIKSTAEWDGYGYHETDTTFEPAYADYDTEETGEGHCKWCDKDFPWCAAPAANKGLRENAKSYSSILHRTKGLLARLIQDRNEHETECEQLIAMIENRLDFDEEKKQ